MRMVEKRFLILSFRLLVLCGQAIPRMASALPPGDSDVADLAFVRKQCVHQTYPHSFPPSFLPMPLVR